MAEQNMSMLAYFLNTTPAATTPTYDRIGDGVTTSKMNFSPQKTTETYIHENTAHTTVDSYQPELPMTMKVYPGDDVYDFLEGLLDANGGPTIGGNANTQLVVVKLWGTPDTAGTSFPAKRWNVAISFESEGGEGGGKAEIEFTLNILGSQVAGTFNTSTLAFTAS